VIRALAPRYWVAHATALVLAGIAVVLGLWQYDAWQAHRAADAVDPTTLTPIALTDALGPDEPFPGDRVGQPVVVEGTWLPESTVYVSGRENAGRDGYWVITPIAVGAPDGPALPIVRGWTPDPDAAPAAPAGPAELVAWLQPPEGTGATDDDPTDDVLPQVRIADLVQRVDQDLYGAYAVVADLTVAGDWPVGARATNPGTAGLAPASLDEVPRSSRFTAIRNLFYALQWWLFGGFALFVWWRHVADRLAAEQAVADAPDEGTATPREPTPADAVPSDP
jgi:surfeit locus 1 family protein